MQYRAGSIGNYNQQIKIAVIDLFIRKAELFCYIFTLDVVFSIQKQPNSLENVG